MNRKDLSNSGRQGVQVPVVLELHHLRDFGVPNVRSLNYAVLHEFPQQLDRLESGDLVLAKVG